MIEKASIVFGICIFLFCYFVWSEWHLVMQLSNKDKYVWLIYVWCPHWYCIVCGAPALNLTAMYQPWGPPPPSPSDIVLDPTRSFVVQQSMPQCFQPSPKCQCFQTSPLSPKAPAMPHSLIVVQPLKPSTVRSLPRLRLLKLTKLLVQPFLQWPWVLKSAIRKSSWLSPRLTDLRG